MPSDTPPGAPARIDLTALLDELDAGRLDSEVARGQRGSALALLLRAAALANAGRFGEARDEVHAAVEGAPGQLQVLIGGARVLFAARDVRGALAILDG